MKTVSWSGVGVTVVLEDGRSIFGDYALCTFSLGILQNDDVVFKPTLPGRRPHPHLLLQVNLLQIGSGKQLQV